MSYPPGPSEFGPPEAHRWTEEQMRLTHQLWMDRNLHGVSFVTRDGLRVDPADVSSPENVEDPAAREA